MERAEEPSELFNSFDQDSSREIVISLLCQEVLHQSQRRDGSRYPYLSQGKDSAVASYSS